MWTEAEIFDQIRRRRSTKVRNFINKYKATETIIRIGKVDVKTRKEFVFCYLFSQNMYRRSTSRDWKFPIFKIDSSDWIFLEFNPLINFFWFLTIFHSILQAIDSFDETSKNDSFKSIFNTFRPKNVATRRIYCIAYSLHSWLIPHRLMMTNNHPSPNTRSSNSQNTRRKLIPINITPLYLQYNH